MAYSVEEYKQKLDELKQKIAEKKAVEEKIRADHSEFVEKISNIEAEKNTVEFTHYRSKVNKAPIIFAVLVVISLVASVLYSVYWLKDPKINTFWEGFAYNIMPTLMLILAAVFLTFCIVIALMRKKTMDKASKRLDELETEMNKATAASDEHSETLKRAEDVTKDAEREYNELQQRFFKDHPEELEKVNEQKKKEREDAIRELQEREAVTLKAEEDAKKKQEDLQKGQKMFDYPQAYVLDGRYETEYDVFCASAELGCRDAQIRVVEILLGISYKSGVKPDVPKGEELALRYGEDGNAAMYEILGKGYLYGEGNMPKDEAKGLKYLEKASAKGRQQAMIMAAICHYNGVGCEKDEKRARDFFEKAAKQGNAQAIKVVAAMDNGERLRF